MFVGIALFVNLGTLNYPLNFKLGMMIPDIE